MKFIHFPESEFIMGSNDEADDEGFAKPMHKVILSPFSIASTCVTMGDWHELVLATDYQCAFESDATYRSPTLEHPAVFINWHDATAFCEWKSRYIGKTVRLPTEAGWKYVCRGVAIEPENQTTGSLVRSYNYDVTTSLHDPELTTEVENLWMAL